MEFDYKILEERFKQLPEDIQHALTSIKVADDIKSISETNGLLIDQESVLYNLVSYVLLGLLPSKDFVTQLAKDANIPEQKARKVAEDINQQVIGTIRTSIREAQEAKPASPVISDLEKVGGFNVETHPEPHETATIPATENDRTKLIADLENPAHSSERIVKKSEPENQSYTEPLVDQLLSSTTARPEEQIVQKAAPEAPSNLPVGLPVQEASVSSPKSVPAAPKPAAAPGPKGPDPYREAVN